MPNGIAPCGDSALLKSVLPVWLRLKSFFRLQKFALKNFDAEIFLHVKILVPGFGAGRKMNLVKKITMKDVQLGKSRLQALELQEEIPIMNIAGIATETKTGTSTYGEWTAAIGQFWARNLLNGEEYVSRSVILPPLAQDLITDGLKTGGAVEFAYTITAVPDSSREVNGLKYGIRPVTPIRERDDVQGLKALFGETEKTLPAAKILPQLAAAKVDQEENTIDLLPAPAKAPAKASAKKAAKRKR